jgi:hypothetical protein
MLREPLEAFHYTRYCTRCAAYVPFFLSPRGSLCALCDARLVRAGLEDRATVIGSLPRAVAALRAHGPQDRLALHSQR